VGLDGRRQHAHPYFEQMGTQDQNFFAASATRLLARHGQFSAMAGDDAYVVGVGGTDLTTSSAAGALGIGRRLDR